MRVLLVGCVKTQLGGPAPAEELFVSPLFRCRRRYAEASGYPWFVLSSRHGLLRPDDVVEPYDLPLGRRPVAYRRSWGADAVRRLAGELGGLSGVALEVHAGAAHVDPLREPLSASGAHLLTPLRGLTQGQHLAWYARGGTSRPNGDESGPAAPILGDHGVGRETVSEASDRGTRERSSERKGSG